MPTTILEIPAPRLELEGARAAEETPVPALAVKVAKPIVTPESRRKDVEVCAPFVKEVRP